MVLNIIESNRPAVSPGGSGDGRRRVRLSPLRISKCIKPSLVLKVWPAGCARNTSAARSKRLLKSVDDLESPCLGPFPELITQRRVLILY